MSIKAPFNFVPVSPMVYFPQWADEIFQDIPFSDGISGMIKVKIKAESPLFIRNGHTRLDAEQKTDEYMSFCKNPENRYFIPGTSIKGAIRNVLEIKSFGKMCQLDDKRYSVRDLKLDKYLSSFQKQMVHCGWMTKEGDVVHISDNGIPLRISQREIDEHFNTNFCRQFSVESGEKLSPEKRSPLYKYKLLKNRDLSAKFIEIPGKKNPVDTRIMVKFDGGGREGTVVFTGQPGLRQKAQKNLNGEITKKASGKFYEFVFPKETKGAGYSIEADDEKGLYGDFCFVYNDSEEWKYWKRKLENGEKVPVFFIPSADGREILHFGLSYLYKLPYPKRVKGYLPRSEAAETSKHLSEKLDMAECIFGTASSKHPLKGRVQFSNAYCTSGNVAVQPSFPYMGSPKPSYYPIYLKQHGSYGEMQTPEGKGVPFKTMFDEDASIRGWKRYPVRDEWISEFIIPDNQMTNTNPFIPMEKGAEFICKVRFFNLRPTELGALVSSIELGEGFFHSIGFAKPFGYGCVSMNITDIDSESGTIDKGTVINKFVELMSENIDNYLKSPQLREFRAMSRPQERLMAPLEYMELNEFVQNKKQHFYKDKNQTFGYYQQDYSNLIVRQRQVKKIDVELFDAIVTYAKGPLKKAKINEPNSQPFELSIPDSISRVKLSSGDLIKVKKLIKGGNTTGLEFVSKS